MKCEDVGVYGLEYLAAEFFAKWQNKYKKADWISYENGFIEGFLAAKKKPKKEDIHDAMW